ncbi:ferredoxin [Thermotalea metallivorans]|uniref:ferredoxin n=1 Tax=Thermotalea metallivorans TaxID=520762 RepID=UPI001FA77BD6
MDKNSCISCGLCGGLCPDVFQAGLDGKAISLDKELSGELLVMAKHAESICPTWSISLQTSFPNL